MIKYTVELLDLNLHFYKVTLVISNPLNNQVLMMPNWIPGSYVIRDFSKQLSGLTVFQAEKPAYYQQTKNNEWIVQSISPEPLLVTYLVYAYDKSVRGAYLDLQRGFFNSTSLCLCPLGFEEEAIELEIVSNGLDWQVVTGLSCAEATEKYRFGKYVAKNYAQLIDCPVLMGKLSIRSFMVNDIPHDIAVSGDQEGDLDRLTQDVQKICQTQAEFFKGLPKEIKYYCFLLHVSAEGYGGIEHVNSSSLLINKFALPIKHNLLSDSKQKPKAYIDLLGLFSHEYFHLWMVKQIKPAIFLNYDLTQPNYTTQLWAFEGFTAYYDDLMLVRSGLITPQQYLSILAENINKLFNIPGRKHQTLKSASFDAWTKFYKPDENSMNSTISYYLKGALLALCCDLQLRTESQHEHNLDMIMSQLWKNFGEPKVGVKEENIEELINQYQFHSVQELLKIGLNQTDELPIKSIFEKFGLVLNELPLAGMPMLNLSARLTECYTQVLCQEVYYDGILASLGVQPGDILVACNDHRLTFQNHQILLQRFVGQTVLLYVFRDDKLVELSGVIQPNFVKQLEISPISGLEENVNKWIFGK